MTLPPLARRGLLLVLSSPSGAGKSTIARLLLDKSTGLKLSISVTTRERRPSEVDGVHYRFVSKREFALMRERDELLEWAEVHGNNYGTPRDFVEDTLAEGNDVLFDIDWQGADQLRAAMPEDVVSVFVLPPSGAELRARLVRRAEDDDDTIRKRLQNAREEFHHHHKYDYVVVNTELQAALAGVEAILRAERLRQRRLAGLEGFVSDISAEL
ncbi:MAG: guanylate kinase [Pseudomonadota bacterium]